ncbi:MAG: PIG-L family deacetylase [Clostridia bacterium]|nr:PIG-L family deacetylase [Clostridia bacterium]
MKKSVSLFLAAGLLLAARLLFAGQFAAADTAREITSEASFGVPQIVSGTLRRMTDRNTETAMQVGQVKEPVVNITMKGDPCAAVYIEFGNNIMPFTVQVKEGGGWVEIASWDEPYAQAYVEFPAQTQFRLRFETGGKYKNLYIREIYLFGEGERNDTPQIWEPPCEKADLLLLVAHPDDELLWFGGLLPTYAGERGLNVQVCYLTCGNSCRRVELLNGLWHCGVRNYPDIGDFEDIKSYDASKLYPKWGGTGAVDLYVARLLRRYQPEVAVTQALDGEYGHAAHVVCARSMSRACELAADPEYDPESAALWGVWTGKKVYLHKGDSPTLTMDWRQPLSAFGGKTGFEVTEEAYLLHMSQPHDKNGKKSLYYITPEDDENSSFVYTLIYSTVGEDVLGGDMFENVPLP